MNRMFTAAVFTLALMPLATLGGVKVSSLDLVTQGANGFISVALSGRSNELPDLKVYGNTIEVAIPQADAFSAITKSVRGAQLSANPLNGKAIVKAILPYEVNADAVNLGWKNNGFEIVFPRGKAAIVDAQNTITARAELGVSPKEITPAAPAPAPIKKIDVSKNSNIVKEALNEDYLNKLMKENKTEDASRKDSEINENTQAVAVESTKNDEITVKQSSALKVGETNEAYTFAGYAAKFTLFLALVLGLFYGIIQLLKKGVFNRGKLGFLNNAQMIEVLSTTYVAPKRSLMVVRAHKQIFLVGNSESGLTFLSEMTDTSGLIKEGEKQVTGTNFDLNLNDAAISEFIGVKVKENIMESTPIEENSGLTKLAAAKDDIVKFSDELKKKAKKLKPIEFN
jgi:flagellar biogenesis protein FliO